MATKVKLKEATVKAPLVKLPSPAWQMNSLSCNVFASLDPKSVKGKKINMAMLDYEKKCSQAKIEMIDEIKIIVKPLRTDPSKKNPRG